MIRKKCVYVLGSGCLILALATAELAADPAPPETSAAKAEPASAEPPVAEAAKADPADKQEASAAAEDPVICKKVEVTGSRIRKEKVCRTRSQWAGDTRAAKDFVRGVERGGASQPGDLAIGD